jgi:hypothetical protein
MAGSAPISTLWAFRLWMIASVTSSLSMLSMLKLLQKSAIHIHCLVQYFESTNVLQCSGGADGVACHGGPPSFGNNALDITHS